MGQGLNDKIAESCKIQGGNRKKGFSASGLILHLRTAR